MKKRSTLLSILALNVTAIFVGKLYFWSHKQNNFTIPFHVGIITNGAIPATKNLLLKPDIFTNKFKPGDVVACAVQTEVSGSNLPPTNIIINIRKGKKTYGSKRLLPAYVNSNLFVYDGDIEVPTYSGIYDFTIDQIYVVDRVNEKLDSIHRATLVGQLNVSTK